MNEMTAKPEQFVAINAAATANKYTTNSKLIHKIHAATIREMNCTRLISNSCPCSLSHLLVFSFVGLVVNRQESLVPNKHRGIICLAFHLRRSFSN